MIRIATNIIKQTIYKYISSITLPNQTKAQKETKRFIVLPKKSKSKLVEESYSQVDFNVAFKSPKTIGTLFPFKDQIKQKTSQSLVVYKINCKTCNVDYIGKTERILVHRLKEHQKKKQTTNKSACYEHIEENPTHEMDYENIQVFDRASSIFKLRMKELLQEQPELNK